MHTAWITNSSRRPPVGGPPPGDRESDEHDREADPDEGHRDAEDLAVRRGGDVLAAADRATGRGLAEELRRGQVDRDREPDDRQDGQGETGTAIHGEADAPVDGPAEVEAPLPAGAVLGAAAAMSAAIVG
jgi:hypothetical protein